MFCPGVFEENKTTTTHHHKETTMAKASTTRQQQTTRIAGKRVRIVTTTTKDGGTKVTVTDAAPKEWELQAAQVRRLRAMPEFARTAEDVLEGKGKFTLAGDQNSAKRGPRAQQEAMAAGMTSGEHDVRIYMQGGVLGLIENKVGNAALLESQRTRHPLLAALGFTRQAVVRAVTTEDAATQAEELVLGWLADLQKDAA